MICLETQKIYVIASQIEMIAENCKTAMECGKMKKMAKELVDIADKISLDMECAED